MLQNSAVESNTYSPLFVKYFTSIMSIFAISVDKKIDPVLSLVAYILPVDPSSIHFDYL